MTKKARRFIGVFDSGFGGLDILRGIVKELPNYNYIYLGDTARSPYGSRSKEQVYEFTRQAVDFLFQNNCGLVILACNTASSQALRKIQQKYLPQYYPTRKVLGVLIPAVQETAKKTKNKKIGVMATEGTVRSRAFIRELKKLNSGITVFQKACPLLVPLVEAGEKNSKAMEIILKDYLYPLEKKDIDTLILGCTHYGILKNKIKKILGKWVHIVSETKVVPLKLKNYLERHKEIEENLGKEKKRYFYTTDLTEKFKTLGSKFFGRRIQAKKITLT